MKKRIFVTITAFALILIASLILKNTVFNSQADENKDIAFNETTTEESTEAPTEKETFILPEIDLTEDVYYGTKSENNDDSDIDKVADNKTNELDTTRPITVDELDDLDESSEEFTILEPVTKGSTKDTAKNKSNKGTASKDKASNTTDNKSSNNKSTETKSTTSNNSTNKSTTSTTNKDTTNKNTSTVKVTEPTTKPKPKVIVIDESSTTKKDKVKDEEYKGEDNSGKIDWDKWNKEAATGGEVITVISDLSGENVGTWEKPN